MTATASVRRQPVAARRMGYVVAAAINAAMLYVANIWPGWQVLPFLTDETSRVLGWVNLTLMANVVVNIVYVVYDPRWVKALGDLMTAGVGLASTIRILQVFPFNFTGYAFDWALLVRVVLIVGVVGTALGVIIQCVSLIRQLVGLSTRDHAKPRVP